MARRCDQSTRTPLPGTPRGRSRSSRNPEARSRPAAVQLEGGKPGRLGRMRPVQRVHLPMTRRPRLRSSGMRGSSWRSARPSRQAGYEVRSATDVDGMQRVPCRRPPRGGSRRGDWRHPRRPQRGHALRAGIGTRLSALDVTTDELTVIDSVAGMFLRSRQRIARRGRDPCPMRSLVTLRPRPGRPEGNDRQRRGPDRQYPGRDGGKVR